MSVKIREQRGKLYLDIYQGGVRKWESLHITLSEDKRQNKELYRLAEICRSKREAQLLAGEWGIKNDTIGGITLVSCIKKHEKNLANPSPLRSLLAHIEKFSNGATILIGQVTPKWLEDFQANLLVSKKPDGQLLSQSSVSLYMRFLRVIFRKAVAEGIISRDPTASIQIVKKVDPDMVFLSEVELRQLAAYIPDSVFEQEVRRAFLFGCFTGLRVSDIRSLTWGMIERNPPQIIKRQKKTKNQVFVPLNKSAAGLIFDGADHQPDDFVFALNNDAKDIIRGYRALKKWADAAGLSKKIGWHTARRTFATLALGCGADAITVARLLGHSGIGQVMKYAKATDEMKRRAVDALPDLF